MTLDTAKLSVIYAMWRYAECRYAECYYAECHGVSLSLYSAKL